MGQTFVVLICPKRGCVGGWKWFCAAVLGAIGMIPAGCARVYRGPIAEVATGPRVAIEVEAIPVVWHRLASYSADGMGVGVRQEAKANTPDAKPSRIPSPVDPFLASVGTLDGMLSADVPARDQAATGRSMTYEEWASAEEEAKFIEAYPASKAGGGIRGIAAGYTMMGLLVMREGRYTASVRLLERALAQEPELKAARCLLAKAYIALGYRTRALHHVRRVLAVDPDDEWAQRLLFSQTHRRKRANTRKYAMSLTAPAGQRRFCMAMPAQGRL